jgi:hypothetical protein
MEFGRLAGTEPRLIHISTEMLMRIAPDVFSHVAQEKMYCGVFDNTKIRRDAPEFVCEYSLAKITDALYRWYESDPDASVIDEDLDRLEDSIVEKYHRCMEIMRG